MVSRTRIGVTFGLLLSFSASASAQAQAQAQAPDSSVCAMSAQAATSAAQLRDSGKPKSYLEKALPAREIALNTPTGAAIYQTLDDVYSFTDVGPFAHYYYRIYICYLRSEGKPVPAAFGLVNSAFVACQKENGSDQSEKLGLCLLQAINAAAVPPEGL